MAEGIKQTIQVPHLDLDALSPSVDSGRVDRVRRASLTEEDKKQLTEAIEKGDLTLFGRITSSTKIPTYLIGYYALITVGSDEPGFYDLLLKKGPISTFDLQTCLKKSISNSKSMVFDYLLENFGLDDEIAEECLQLAIATNHHVMIRKLMDKFSYPHETIEKALYLSVEGGNKGTVELFLGLVVMNESIRDNALKIAAEKSQTDILDLFI